MIKDNKTEEIDAKTFFYCLLVFSFSLCATKTPEIICLREDGASIPLNQKTNLIDFEIDLPMETFTYQDGHPSTTPKTSCLVVNFTNSFLQKSAYENFVESIKISIGPRETLSPVKINGTYIYLLQTDAYSTRLSVSSKQSKKTLEEIISITTVDTSIQLTLDKGCKAFSFIKY